MLQSKTRLPTVSLLLLCALRAALAARQPTFLYSIPVPECFEEGKIAIPYGGLCTSYFQCDGPGSEAQLKNCPLTRQETWFDRRQLRCVSIRNRAVCGRNDPPLPRLDLSVNDTKECPCPCGETTTSSEATTTSSEATTTSPEATTTELRETTPEEWTTGTPGSTVPGDTTPRTAGSTPEVGTTMTPLIVVGAPCKTPYLEADLVDCTKYYRCVGYTWTLEVCGTGTRFSPSWGTCEVIRPDRSSLHKIDLQ